MITRPGETRWMHASATNAAAVVTVPSESRRPYISKMVFSYSATPTNGRVTVTIGGEVVFSHAITAAGVGPLNVNIGGEVGASMTVTLAAGGSGVVGDLSVERFDPD
jgi:molybdopterin-binding protein